ncbi:UNVERIFIED_ORG: hypothetical protein BCL66_106220 [Martelella mediterranea]
MAIDVSIVSGAPIWLDYLTAAGSGATVLALGFAAWSIWQNAKARNLSTIVEVFRDLQNARDSLKSYGLIDLENDEFGIYSYLQFLEYTCWMLNSRAVSGDAKRFLQTFLDAEVPSIVDSDLAKPIVEQGELQDLEKYDKRARLRNEKSAEKARRQSAVIKTFRSVESLRELREKKGPLHDKITELKKKGG